MLFKSNPLVFYYTLIEVYSTTSVGHVYALGQSVERWSWVCVASFEPKFGPLFFPLHFTPFQVWSFKTSQDHQLIRQNYYYKLNFWVRYTYLCFIYQLIFDKNVFVLRKNIAVLFCTLTISKDLVTVYFYDIQYSHIQ